MEGPLASSVGYTVRGCRETAQVQLDKGAADVAHTGAGYLHVDTARGDLAAAVEICRLWCIFWRGKLFRLITSDSRLHTTVVGYTPFLGIAVRVRQKQTGETRRSLSSW